MKKKILLLISLLPMVALAATDKTVASIANSVSGNLPGLEELMVSMSYIFGIVLGIKGILKLKEHNESKGQVKLVVPIVLVIAAALFLALPSTIETGKKTLGFGSEKRDIRPTGGSSGGSAY